MHQEILLPGTSTVMEYLTFHAALRMPLTQAAAEAAGAAAAAAHGKPLPADASTAQRVAWQLSAAGRAAARAETQAQAQAVRQRVHEVVKVLGLSKVAHSFIGDAFVRGLSGERKARSFHSRVPSRHGTNTQTAACCLAVRLGRSQQSFNPEVWFAAHHLSFQTGRML